MISHLTDEDFAELLSGAGSASAQEHLGICEACKAEVARASCAIDSFRQESLDWAKARHAASGLHLVVPRDRKLLRFSPGRMEPTLRSAAAVVLACGVLGGAYRLATLHSQTEQQSTVESAASVAAEPSSARHQPGVECAGAVAARDV